MIFKRCATWALASVLLLATGCGSKPAEPAAPSSPAPSTAPAQAPAPASGEIEFFLPESPGVKDGFTAVAEAFKAKNPNVKVNIRSTPFAQYSNQLKVMWASNTVADVVLPGSSDIRNYYVNGALLPLDPILSKQQTGEFVDAVIESVVHDGKPYGYPWRESAQAMYYNKEYFAAAGIAAPTTVEGGWTWEQWLTNIQKVVAAAEAKQGGKVWGTVFLANPPDQNAGDYWYNPLIRSAGAKGSNAFAAISPDGTKVGGYLDAPESLKALQFFQDLYVKHKLIPQAEVQDAFGSGKAATMISFVQTGTTLKKSFPNLQWGVMPLPYHVTPMSHTGGLTMAISAKSKNPAAALEFVQFAGSEEGLVAFFKASGSFIPARKSVLEKREHFPSDYEQFFLQVLAKQGVARPNTAAYPMYSSGVGKLLRDIALGAEVPEAVKATVLELDDQLQNFK